MKQIRVLLCGLEKSGKSTLVSSFQNGQFTVGAPSTTQQITDIVLGDSFTITVVEVGGRQEVRRFVSEVIDYVDAILFLVDGTDENHLDEMKKEFDKLINHPQSVGKPLVILFHKKEIANIHPSFIVEQLNVLNIYDRPHQVFSTTAKQPMAFQNVLNWIKDRLTEDFYPIQDKHSRLLTLSILDMLDAQEKGLPVLSIMGQLELISRVGQVEYDRDKIFKVLRKLIANCEIEYNSSLQVWKITQKGKDKLFNSDLTKGDKFEKLRAILDGSKTSSSGESKSGQDTSESAVLDEFELEELGELLKKTNNKD
ncbi:MAG: ADP-ribosylation factor-like protein [Promethearchaeota archaeon]